MKDLFKKKIKFKKINYIIIIVWYLRRFPKNILIIFHLNYSIHKNKMHFMEGPYVYRLREKKKTIFRFLSWHIIFLGSRLLILRRLINGKILAIFFTGSDIHFGICQYVKNKHEKNTFNEKYPVSGSIYIIFIPNFGIAESIRTIYLLIASGRFETKSILQRQTFHYYFQHIYWNFLIT